MKEREKRTIRAQYALRWSSSRHDSDDSIDTDTDTDDNTHTGTDTDTDSYNR